MTFMQDSMSNEKSSNKNAYLDYVCEREELTLLQIPHAFALYNVQSDHVYLRDVYVEPDFRMLGICKQIVAAMIDVAKQHDLQAVITTVSPPAKGSTDSLVAALKCGFKLLNSDKDVIYLVKHI